MSTAAERDAIVCGCNNCMDVGQPDKDVAIMDSKNIDNSLVSLADKACDDDAPESRFQLLWNEAERIKRDNSELESQLDLLVQRIKNSVGPVEIEMGRELRVQIDKIISFGGRKSLPQWQSHALDDWIMSSMDCLQSLGLVDDALTESFATLQAQTLGVEIDVNGELSVAEQLAAYMELQMDDTVAEDLTVEIDESEYAEWYDNQFTQSDIDDCDSCSGEESSDSAYEHDADQSESLQPEAVFRTLFHRVARALHPDKETDPNQRQIKQALMAQLLEARRQRDLMSVFQLYREYVDDAVAFNITELAELETLLRRYIEIESQRQVEITTKTHLHDVAYTQYYSDDPNKVNQAIAQKIWDIKKRKNEIEVFSETVTSFKKLGPYLEDRFEQLQEYF